MECDLEMLTVKQKIKELMKWQETHERSFQNQDSSNTSGTGRENLYDADKIMNENISNDHSPGKVVGSYDRLLLTSKLEENGEKSSNEDNVTTIKPKKPFLRKGAGLARYKMSPNTVSLNRYKPRQSNRPDEKTISLRNKSPAKPKLSEPIFPDDYDLVSSELVQATAPNKSEDVTKWSDVLQKQSEMSSREADELKIFEMLEEKAAESSFCSSSSVVAKFMGLTVRSTPKKNKTDNDRSLCITRSETLKLIDLNCPKKEEMNGVCYLSSDGESDFASSDCDSEKSSCSLTSEGRMILSLIDKYREFAMFDGDFDSKSFSNFTGNNINDLIYRTNRAQSPVKIREIRDAETVTGDKDLELDDSEEQSSDEEVDTTLDPNKNEDIKLNTSTNPKDECTSNIMTTNYTNKDGGIKTNKVNDSLGVDGSIPNEAGLINESCNIQFYMKKIQEELKNLENETERVRQVRGKYEEEYRKFKREKETFLRTHENERRLFEIEIEEEKKKLQKERAVFERHSKPLRSKPTLALENEIKMLQEKVLKLQDELKEKQKNWAISQSSVRSQLHSLVEANKTLRQEMIVMKDRERKLLEKEKRKTVHSYRQKSQFKNVNDHLEAVNEAEFEPPTVVECKNSNNSTPTNTDIRIKKSNLVETGNKNVEDLSFPVEKPLKIVHSNGDIQITYDDGTNHYYFKESSVWHKKYNDGLELVVFDDGQIETKFEDGTREVVYTNGCRKLFVTSGDELWCYKNGDHVIVKKDGDRVLAFASGEIEIHRKDFKLKQYPDSSCKYLFANGVTETRYADGRVRVKDKEGNLLKDNKQDLTQQCIKLLDKVMTSS